MEEIFNYLLKSAGVLSIFVLIYHFLLRRLTFFQANRWFLLFGMLASMAFPLIEITQTVYVEQPEMVVLPQQLMPHMAYALQEPLAEPLINVNQMLLLLYASISLFFLGKMAVELLSLRRLIRSGKASKEDGFMRISLPRKVTPFSFFNYICFYEKEENNPANDLILKHEQVHAREWHSVDLLLTHVYCAIFWINPLAWWLKRQIGENLEFIADATAKVENTTGISYERTLLSSAASHMQPALANNFFTPFIKKRIQMLQKETSKTWNAYKYALILPVIVLFLYSFNTVTKTEYIKSKLEASQSIEEPLVFDITAATSQLELERFVEMINDYADFKMDLKMETSDSGNKVFKVYTAFGDKKLFNNFSMEFTKEKLVLMEVSKDQARLNDTETNETITITAKGTTTTEIDQWLYTEDDATNNVTRSEVSNIRFTIPPTTTNESLERIQKTLKTEYNVDFSYSNLKYKDGKIVSIKIALDDNRGFKGSQNYNNNVRIPTICIVGVIEENNKSWSMGNCGETTYSINSVSYMNDLPEKSRAIIDSIYISRNGYKRMETDSLQLTLRNLQSNLSKLPNDRINLKLKAQLEKAQAQLEKMDRDSLQRYLESSTLELKTMQMNSLRDQMNIRRDSMSNQMKTWRDSLRGNIMLQRQDRVKWRDSMLNNQRKGILTYQNRSTGDGFRTSKSNPPLYILDGKVMKEFDVNSVDPNEIKSVSVFKGEQAKALYGKAAADGAIVIVTKKDGSKNKSTSKSAQFTAQSISLTPNDKSLTIYTPYKIDGIFGFTSKDDPYILVDDKRISQAEFNKLDPQTIKLIHVWNGNDAMDRYGKNAKNGVIDIVLKSAREMKLTEAELQNEMFPAENEQTWTSSNFSYSISIDKFTDAELEKFKVQLKNEGYDFKLISFRKTGDKVTKLKFNLDGTAYTFEPNTGMKRLTVTISETDKEPKVSAVTY